MPKKSTTALTIVPPQRGMFDHEVIDPTLHALIEEAFKLKAKVKAYNKGRKTIREAFALMPNIKDGDRVVIRQSSEQEARVPFIIVATERRGGGHTVEAWTRIGIGSIDLFNED